MASTCTECSRVTLDNLAVAQHVITCYDCCDKLDFITVSAKSVTTFGRQNGSSVKTETGNYFFVDKSNYNTYREFIGINRDSALHIACQFGLSTMVSSILEQNLFDVNEENSDGITPLMVACQWGHKVIVELLLENGANLSSSDFQDNTVMHYSVQSGNHDFIKFIIGIISGEHSYILNAQNVAGESVIMKAFEKNGLDEIVGILGTLMDNGASPFLYDNRKKTLFRFAINSRNEQVATFLMRRKNFIPESLNAAFLAGDIDDILFLKANLKLYYEDGKTLLHYTVIANISTSEIMSLLPQLMDECDLKSEIDIPDVYDKTPLMYACEESKTVVAEILIQHGSKVILNGGRSWSPLHLYFEVASKEVRNCILSNIAQTDMSESELIDWMLKNNEFMNTCNAFGYSWIFRAFSIGGNEELKDRLLRKLLVLESINFVTVGVFGVRLDVILSAYIRNRRKEGVEFPKEEVKILIDKLKNLCGTPEPSNILMDDPLQDGSDTFVDAIKTNNGNVEDIWIAIEKVLFGERVWVKHIAIN